MESRVSNLETSVVDSHERVMESRVKNAETTLGDLQKKIKSNNELILQMLQSLAARVGVGSSSSDNSSKGTHTYSKIREGLNPNIGPNFKRPDSCRTSHPPFIKMASHISVLKSDEIVLKLQSFHNEKIQARDKVDEFLSQYHPKYKLKSPPCLRPTLKKFNRVRDYAKYHKDGSARFHFSSKFQESFGLFRSALARKNEMIFDLLDKQVDDSMESPPFLDSDCKIGTAKNLVFGFLISKLLEKSDDLPSSRPILENMVGFQLIVFVGMISGIQSLKNLDKEALEKFGFMGFDHCFTHEFTGSHALQVFDERSHSADCDFQLGYHMPISDTGSTLYGLLTSNVQNKDAHISKFLICTGKFMKNRTIVHLKFGFHELILDKGGTIIQRLLNSKSTGKIETILVQEHASAQLLDALQPFGGFYNDAIVSVSFQFTYHKGIRDKGGIVYLSEFNSMDLLAICELGFALNATYRHFLEEVDLLIVSANQTRIAFSMFDEIPDSSCYVVVHCDMCYCKGIRDKGEGSKFRKSTGDEENTVNLYFNQIGCPSSLPTN